MNRKKLRMALMLIALVLTGATFTSAFQSTMNGNQVKENILFDLNTGLVADDYTVHDPIVITSDSDFASQGWPGSGTLEDPYLIDGLSIEGAYLESCIEIADTRAYFVMSNCLLYGTEGPLWDAGLYLTNVTNGLIEQNVFTQNGHRAIHLHRSQNNTIHSNEVYANENRGIYLSESDNNTLTDNNCSDNNAGIHVFQSDGVNILNNTCNQNTVGIIVSGGPDRYSNYTIIANNTCENNTFGIHLITCASGLVANNTCSDNSIGIYVTSSILITVTENVVFENTDGINVVASTDVSVTWNALIDNEYNGFEMLSTTTLFDYNYWSDYTGVDEDEDGIGDTPYQIDVIGEEPPYLYCSVLDNHPLMYWPWFEPTTTTTTTTTTDETTTTTETTGTGTTNGEVTDGDDQPVPDVIVGVVIAAAACIIIVIVLVQRRRNTE